MKSMVLFMTAILSLSLNAQANDCENGETVAQVIGTAKNIKSMDNNSCSFQMDVEMIWPHPQCALDQVEIEAAAAIHTMDCATLAEGQQVSGVIVSKDGILIKEN